MGKEDKLVMNIYRMNDRRGCLVMVTKGKPLKILDILEPLKFVAWIKQLSIAIDTGAGQDCSYNLICLDRNEHKHKLQCRYLDGIVRLEVYFKKQFRMNWKGTARDFADVVDRMIAQLPGFY